MPNRDPLDAAQAKIEALERDLKDARDALATKATPKPKPERARRVETARPEQLEDMKTLAEHNQALPPSTEWPGARVLCTSCKLAGARVEMVVRALLSVHEDRDAKLVDVVCLRCGATGVKRARATRP